MSICRLAEDCDVYLFCSVFGGWEFIAPKVYGHAGGVVKRSPRAAYQHLKRLRNMGLQVPYEALSRMATVANIRTNHRKMRTPNDK